MDFISVIQFLYPESSMAALGIAGPVAPLTRFALMNAASLMAGWTLLLLWVNHRPVERRGVILLTVPIALGIAGSFWYLLVVGILPAAAMSVLAAPILTAAVFAAAYLAAVKISKTNTQTA
jgi:hypothetical protein